MIEKIKIVNWRSHKDSEFDFGPGVNALIGIMGSGKTSVLDALCFALFGTFPAHRAREVTLDDIIRSRPKPQSESSVQVDFTIDGNPYRIVRQIKRGKGSIKTELHYADRVIESSASRVEEKIESLLKVDYYLFSRATYAQQNSLEYFLNLQPGKRREQIDQLLKLDRIEKVRKNCSTLINRLKDRKEISREFLKSQDEEELKQIPKVESQIEQMKSAKRESELKLSHIKEKKKQVGKRLVLIEKERKEIELLAQKSKSLEGQLSSLKEDQLLLQKKLEKFHFAREKIDEELEEKKSGLKEIESTKDELRKVSEKLVRRKASIKERLGSLQEEREKFEKLQDRCPRCKQKLTPEHRKKLLEENGKRMASLRKKLKEIEPKMEENEKSIKDLKKKHEKLHSYAEELKQLLRDKERIKMKEERRTRLAEKKEEIGKELSEKKKKFPEKQVKKIQQRLQDLEGQKNSLEEKIRSFRARKKDKLKELTRLKNLKQRLEKAKKKIKKIVQLRKESNSFQKALKETQHRLRDEFITAINSTMSKLWKNLYPYDDYQSIQFKTSGEDYLLELQELSGKWVPVEGIASGGERTVASLALRIGFSLALTPSLSLLVLDEPTHNLDKNAIDEMASLLREQVDRYIDQVLLITHNPELEKAVTGYLYRLDRDKSKNEPTQVKKVVA